MKHTKIVILGAGPAGYTAALYAARAGLNPIILAGPLPGGQLVYTHHIENYPGFGNVPGMDLVDVFKKQVEELGVEILYESAVKVNIMTKPFTITMSNGGQMSADSLVIATGSSPKWLNAQGEERFKGQGVSICATCDGFFYRGKSVAVVGGGNTALYEALFMATIAKDVTIIHRDSFFTGEKALQNQIKDHDNIRVLWNTEVVSFEGQERLSSINIKNNQTLVVESLKIDGVFEAVGQTPNSELFVGQLDMDENGYIVTNHDTRQTSVPGVFAAGDVQEPFFRQAIIACGAGAIAALGAERYLVENGM